MTTSPTIRPAVRMELRSIDWVLARLAVLLVTYPARRADLTRRIDDALDERLRLMRLRDGVTPFPGFERN
jgi:hypothetical protein